MDKKILGDTKEQISPIGQGTMGLGGYFFAEYENDSACIKALQYGLDCGLSFIDTAEIYGGGHAEELIGKAFKGKRDNIFLATKVSPENLSKEGVIAAAEGSLKRLNTDVIDLYQIHWPNPAIPIEETAQGLNQLVEEGKIRHIGVSNFSVPEIKALMPLCKIATAQSEYNLFDQTPKFDLLPFCQEHKITLIAYSPLDKMNSAKVLESFAKGYTASQIILGWLISKEGVIAVPKSGRCKHIKENSEPAILSQHQISILDECGAKVEYIEPNKILCNSEGLENFIPTPENLGDSLLKGLSLKPLRVTAVGNNQYKLLEGKVRYWAWRHAFDNVACPVLIRGDK